MRPTILLTTVLPLLLASSLPLGTPRSAEKEPPLRFTCMVEGVEYDAEEGVAFEVVRGDEKLSVMVRVKPTRRFDAAGIAFDYPRHMSFEFEEGLGYQFWTLDGNDCVILVQRFPGADLEGMMQGMIDDAAESLGLESVESKPMDLRLGAATVKARRCRLEIGEFMQTWILCTVEAGESSSLLWLQDSSEDDAASKELETILALLGKTFEKKGK